MTEAELLRIDLALELADGNRAHAASILDMPKAQLRDAIHNNPSLAAKWTNPGATAGRAPTEAPTALETMTLGPPVATENAMTLEVHSPSLPPVSPDEAQLAAMVHSNDLALRHDLAESLGLNPEEADEAVALADYHKKHAARSVDIFGATLVKRGLRLSIIIAQLERDIVEKRNLRDIYTEDGKLLIRSGEESKFDLLYRGLAELRKMTELAHTGALARAKMKLWDKHGSMNGRKEKKPGFSPLKRQIMVNNQPGGTVNLHENSNGKTPPPDGD